MSNLYSKKYYYMKDSLLSTDSSLAHKMCKHCSICKSSNNIWKSCIRDTMMCLKWHYKTNNMYLRIYRQYSLSLNCRQLCCNLIKSRNSQFGKSMNHLYWHYILAYRGKHQNLDLFTCAYSCNMKCKEFCQLYCMFSMIYLNN